MTEQPIHEVVYSPESPASSPLQLLSDMMRDLLDSRELARQLARRDIVAQYRQSLLGLAWAFIPPLLSALLFIVLRENQIINIPDPGVPYPVFVLIGTSLWQVFTEAVTAPLRVVNGSGAFLAKVNFPREALILSATYQTLFGLLTRSLLILAVLLYFKIPFTLGSILALVPILLLVWLGIAIGLALTPIGLLATDISSLIAIVLQFAFFVTPVVYPPPKSYPLSLLVQWNPVSPYLLAGRELLVSGSVENLLPMLIITLMLILGTFVGWVAFRVSMPIVIERISA